jgi:hypothetical protein
MSRKLHLFNQEKTYIYKFKEFKNNKQGANAASLPKVRQ